MDAVTYPTPAVTDFITANLIAVRVPFDSQPLAGKFNVVWTPAIVILDPQGQEHHRAVGFQPPEEFIPFLSLGIAKCHFDAGDFSAAMARFQTLAADYPASAAAPEAVFLLGVAGYKSTHTPRPLKEAYERLQQSYPGSEWTKRAFPYSLL